MIKFKLNAVPKSSTDDHDHDCSIQGGIACRGSRYRYRSIVAGFGVDSLKNRVEVEHNRPGLVAEEGSGSSELDLKMPLT